MVMQRERTYTCPDCGNERIESISAGRYGPGPDDWDCDVIDYCRSCDEREEALREQREADFESGMYDEVAA